MSDDKPTIYLLRGNDEYGMSKFIRAMIDRLGDPTVAGMNTNVMDGRACSEDDVRSAALALPFLAERRIVVVHHPLAMLKGGPDSKPMSASARSARERFIGLLNLIPETTALVLVQTDFQKWRGGGMEWETLKESHWLIKWAATAGKRALIRDCLLPQPREMPDWIRAAAKEMGGSFSISAARALAEHIGTDTQVAAREIEKLLTYVNCKRAVEEDDVAQITSQANLTNVFALVDAIGERSGQAALRALHTLLANSEAMEIFAMVIRQFRLLLQTRELIDEGRGDEASLMAEVKGRATDRLNPSQVKRLAAQARRWRMDELEAVYQRLLDLDVGMKTSQVTAETAMDLLIAEIAR